MVAGRVPLISLLKITKKNLNGYNPIEDTQLNTKTFLRDLCIEASEGIWIEWAREDQRERNRGKYHWCSPEFLVELDKGEGRNQVAVCTFYSPKYFCLNDQHLLLAQSNDQGRDQDRDRIQRCESMFQKAVTKSGHLPLPSQLTTDHGGKCSSESWASKQKVCNPKNWGDSFWVADWSQWQG